GSAPWGRDGAKDERRFRRVFAADRGRVVGRGGVDRVGVRHPEPPHAGGALRGVGVVGGTASGGAVRVALDAQARVVAEWGGDGVKRAGAAVPGPAHRRPTDVAAGTA